MALLRSAYKVSRLVCKYTRLCKVCIPLSVYPVNCNFPTNQKKRTDEPFNHSWLNSSPPPPCLAFQLSHTVHGWVRHTLIHSGWSMWIPTVHTYTVHTYLWIPINVTNFSIIPRPSLVFLFNLRLSLGGMSTVWGKDCKRITFITRWSVLGISLAYVVNIAGIT